MAIFVYLLFPTLTDNSRPLEGSLRLGKDQIVAKSDGGLQIMIARRDENGNETTEEVVYERAYYQLALEVPLRPQTPWRCPYFPFIFSLPLPRLCSDILVKALFRTSQKFIQRA